MKKLNRLLAPLAYCFCLIFSGIAAAQNPKPNEENFPDLAITDFKVTEIIGFPENKTEPTVQSYTLKYTATVTNVSETKATKKKTSMVVNLKLMNGQTVLDLSKTHTVKKLGAEEEVQISGSFTFSGTWLYWYELLGNLKLVAMEKNEQNNTKGLQKVLRIN